MREDRRLKAELVTALEAAENRAAQAERQVGQLRDVYRRAAAETEEARQANMKLVGERNSFDPQAAALGACAQAIETMHLRCQSDDVQLKATRDLLWMLAVRFNVDLLS